LGYTLRQGDTSAELLALVTPSLSATSICQIKAAGFKPIPVNTIPCPDVPEFGIRGEDCPYGWHETFTKLQSLISLNMKL
jgi:hypothetical protein